MEPERTTSPDPRGSLVECPPMKRKVTGSILRAHDEVAGQVPSWGRARGNRSVNLSLIDVSLFLPLFPPSLKINKQNV